MRIGPAPTPARGERTRARPQERPPAGERPQRGGRDRGGGRDGRGRTAEVPVPQDERSIELGALFREAQAALRDAKRTLEKRKTEHGDEPEWLVAQYEAAEQRFAEVATEWQEHLSKTGRKIVRR